MTSRIIDGVFSTNLQGHIENICGVDEIIERAKILLTVRKGSFYLNPSLGSMLALTDFNADDDELFGIVCETLAPIKQILVKDVIRDLSAKNVMTLQIVMEINGTNNDLIITI